MRTAFLVAVALACLPGSPQAAGAAGISADEGAVIALDDLGTRLQFDYYTQDAAALRRELASLARLDVPASVQALKQTYAGFGQWKLAELLRPGDNPGATAAARLCIDQLEKAVAAESGRAGLFAILSVCQRLVADLQGRVSAPLAAMKSRQSLERALTIAPNDPHALLIDGINEYERSGTGGRDLVAVRARLMKAANAFAAAPTMSGGAFDPYATAMSWGPAEAWAYLGRLALAQNDIPAARDAFERALVLVADYRQVQELLQGITGRRSQGQ